MAVSTLSATGRVESPLFLNAISVWTDINLGTQAGDPVEARAIAEAFFPDGGSRQNPLYCGSIKTVIGHLEGGAGLAGLLKASLAIQKKTIPPNMHFTCISPAVEPYYGNLCVPTSALPWPETNGQPLRASVNSFGFGGTNAHVILESYQEQDIGQPENEDFQVTESEESLLSKVFVFSAKSQDSLVGNLSKVADYIQSTPSPDLNALSAVLHSRRSAFAFRISVVASSRSSLLEELEKRVISAKATGSNQSGIRSLDSRGTQQQSHGILGIFTGQVSAPFFFVIGARICIVANERPSKQGAQWATMGRELMLHSAPFRESIKKCEQALSLLQDNPRWSLWEEIVAEPDMSRVSQAQFSQPVCTAVQIALTDLLHAVGIKLDTVVGHSSGEIGAAYAAGILNIKDAMGISYYRGLVADLAKGIEGQSGSMIAVGMSYDDATSFCSQTEFRGRVAVAASNGPSSVTLSGDSDAIHEVKQLLDKKKAFARILQVDTAYHSHHMLCCEAQYLVYLRQLGIQVKAPKPDCTWFSSVYPKITGSQSDELGQLKDQYWVDNMTQAVLFSQAVQCALEKAGPFALALEIGPHPALKGPVNQIYKASSAPGASSNGVPSIPYTGCLERGCGDVEVMSKALGLVWNYLGPYRIDLGAWHSSISKTKCSSKPHMLKDLPNYSWNHEQIYWHESRLSHNYRLGQHTPHELLGRLKEVCQQEMTWRNILRLEAIPWLRGHMFQGQVVFPGAGYVSMALQASKFFVEEQEQNHKMRTVEIRDLEIIKAMIIEEDTPGVEMLFTIKGRDRSADDTVLEADFTAYSCSDGRAMTKCSQGHLLIHLLRSASSSLPPMSTSDRVGDLPSLDVERFFSAVSGLGIAYEGPFRALKSIEQARGHAKAIASWSNGDLGNEHLLHPAVLDVAFQVGFASFLSMAEKTMGATYLPASVRSVVIDVSRLEAHEAEPDQMCVASQLVDTGSRDGAVIEVDLDICGDSRTASPFIQIEGLTFKAVGEPLASDDRMLFAKTVWNSDVIYGIATPEQQHTEHDNPEYIDAVERTALFFLRTLQEQTPRDVIKRFKPQHRALFRGIDLLLAPIREGRHGVIKKDCLKDTREDIQQFATRYEGSVDLALLTAVGENLPSAVRGQTEILEHMLKDNLLGRLYTEGRGFSTCNGYIAGYMRQISYKYPKTRILEIGAGTGGTTSSVLKAIGDAYVSYTYTDISAGFFEKATERFATTAHKMDFRTLNVEFSPLEQGFEEGSFDVIIAANVLHATRRLADTMKNVRSLLRPGGYLIAVEVTGNMLREPGLMGGLEGWWLGEEDGRFPSPGISAKGWDQVLHETGFSGIDTIAYDMPDIARHNCSSFVTQAIDERLEILRDPLARAELLPEVSGPVLILGGQSLPVSKCIQKAQKLLRAWTPQIQIVTDLDNLDLARIDITGAQVLYLAELDEPIFSRPLTQKRLGILQELLAAAQNVLWVTSGRRADNPKANMAIGIGRALAFELPHVCMQFLDFEHGTPWDAQTMVQHLLRMAFFSSLPKEESSRMLWSHEQEVVVAGEETLVSRVMMNEHANVQFNAGRRRIERRVGPHEHVEISYKASRPGIVLPPHDSTLAIGHQIVDVALSIPLFIGDGELCFLAYGKSRASGAPTIFLSSRDGSVGFVSDDSSFELAKDTQIDSQNLSAVSSAVLGQCCATLMPERGTTVVFVLGQGVDEAVEREAKQLGRKVIFVGTSIQEGYESRPNWLFVHPLERARTIRAMWPEDTAALLYFTGLGTPPKRILESLPKNCAVQVVNPATVGYRKSNIASAYAMAQSLKQYAPQVTTVDRIIEQEVGSTRSILEWRQRDWLSVTVPPLDTQSFFAPDKTYLLVGMTGELGQSLCQFMIRCGARHIVLASRNPPTGYEKWFESNDKTVELNVKMVKMDVTSREEVHATVSEIRKSMPEIAGVANAALVLEDSLFVNTTVPAIEKQFGPKVEGASYLDDEFSTSDLDFFLCFSSLGSVFGNAGQSIYHAANMFTTSLVERRRRRGKAGSVIHVGMIVDAGYVARSSRAGENIEKHLRSQFYMPLAEKEFHHLILQGVLVGRPDPSNNVCSSGEVTMGIQRFVDDPDAPRRPQWYNDPRLSHMILPMSASSSQSMPGSMGIKRGLTSMLEKAVSVLEATDIYQKLFCLKIESMMKVPATSIDTTAPLSNLGLDSLLAVEIRAWLLSDLQLDVPILKIISRESVSSICASAAEQLIKKRITTDEQRKATSVEPAALEVSTTSWMNANSGKADSSDDTTSTHTTTTIDAGLPSPPSIPMTPPELDESVVFEKEIEELAPTTDSLLDISSLPHPQSQKITLTTSGQNGEELTPVLERTERMSYSQASMHFLHNFLDDATTFNVAAHYKVQGPLVVSRFQRALEKVVARHEAYRTHFHADAGGLEPKQRIVTKATASLPRLVHIPSASNSQIQSVFADLKQHKWRLDRGETFLCVLLTHDNSESNTFLFGCHHIIMDGMSWHILFNDLDRAYRLLPLEPVPFSYTDLSRQQLEDVRSGQLDESLDFWMRRLDPIPAVIPLLPLSHRRNRKVTRVYKNHTMQREMAPQMNDQIKHAARGYRVTPMQLCLVALQVLMMQLLELDDEELCIGVTDAGRGTSGHFGETVGHFSNLLPMKFSMGKEKTVADVVSKTAEIVSEGYDNARVPLDLILEKLQIERSMAYTPLFQIAFNYRVGDLLNRSLGNCKLDLVEYRDAKTPYDLTINLTQNSSGSQLVECTSNSYLYTSDATQRLLGMYIDLLDTLSTVDKDTSLCDLKLFSSKDVAGQEVPGIPYLKPEHKWPTRLTERLQQVWTEFPGSPAIKEGTTSLTYDELRVRIQDIAKALRSTGICQGMHVAVLCHPGIDSQASMLAILWIGAVYIPLDVTLPVKRHLAMIHACKPELIIFHEPTSAAVEALIDARVDEGATVAIPTCSLAQIMYSSNDIDEAVIGGNDNCSFILFTSGSTGTPKGITLSQAGIMNYAASKSAFLRIATGVRVLQQSSPGFDMAIAQAFNAFANAGTLIVAPLQARGDPTMIAQLMASEAVEFTLATPTEYLMLSNYANDVLRQCKSWTYACSGGETVTEGLINELHRLELDQLTLTDCYGPTEISCAATFRNVCLRDPMIESAGADEVLGESSSVGHPLPNTSIYIVGADGQPVSSGLPGEVCIGGCGVARGYLDEALSVGKFVQNPFATKEELEEGWQTMYKTGDKGALLPDGSLVFLGRMDLELVKLRGLRIELGEVSRAVLNASHGELTDAVVTVRGQPGFLVAHVVFAQGRTVGEQQKLLASLVSNLPLPRYMIPSFIVPLDHVPTTPNGKVDRLVIASLPLPQANQKEEDTAPQALTVAQGELRLLWREVLGDVVIRADTDFFMVGGSSLLLVRLQNLLKERMGIQIPLHQLYAASTLHRMAAAANHERGLVLDKKSIDWERETAIPAEIQQFFTSVPVQDTLRSSSHLCVLLTGATAFLGSEILRALIAEQDVAEIHCIAAPVGDQQTLISMSDKIMVYSGSLLSPTLGLNSAEQRLLQANIHCIIHAGSQGHCLNNYGSVRQANYISTQFLVSLALPQRIPIHLISSPRVILQSGSCTSTGKSMAEHPPDGDGSQGFTASKWASERFLERVVETQAHQSQTPLSINIHRACSLIGDRAPHDDAMNSVIRYSLLSKTVPHLPNAQGFFDFKDIVDVAKDIARAVSYSAKGESESDSSSSVGGVVFQHHSSNKRVPFNDLAKYLEVLHGGTFRIVSMSEWLKRALELGIEELIVSYLEANVAGLETLMFPYLGE